MELVDSSRFRRSPVIRVMASGLAIVGFLVVIHAFSRGDAGVTEFIVGFSAFAYGLQEVLWPVFVVRPDGLFLARQGFKGLGRIITWSAIRAFRVLGDDRVDLELLDESHLTLKLGSLSTAERERFVTLMGRCTVMANKGIERAAEGRLT